MLLFLQTQEGLIKWKKTEHLLLYLLACYETLLVQISQINSPNK